MEKSIGKVMMIIVLSALAMGADDCGSSPPPSPGGFTIQTDNIVFGPLALPIPVRAPNIEVSGEWQFDRPTAENPTEGDQRSWRNGNSGALGQTYVDRGRAPALWQWGELSGPCTDQIIQVRVNLKKTTVLYCDFTGRFFRRPGLRPTPSSIDVNSPPASVYIHDENGGLPSLGSMPRIEYYDYNGNLVAERQVTEAAPDGTWIGGPTPDLSSVSSGVYNVMIRNGDGSLDEGVAIEVSNILPPPPCDPSPGVVEACERDPWMYWDWDRCSCIAR